MLQVGPECAAPGSARPATGQAEEPDPVLQPLRGHHVQGSRQDETDVECISNTLPGKDWLILSVFLFKGKSIFVCLAGLLFLKSKKYT